MTLLAQIHRLKPTYWPMPDHTARTGGRGVMVTHVSTLFNVSPATRPISTDAAPAPK